MPADRGPKLTVLLSTLGNYEILARVLAGLADQRAPQEAFETLLVVDAADPDPPAVERAVEASGLRNFRLLRGPVPGLSANRNAGLAACTTPIVLFTDNDTIPSRRLVSEHLTWHRRHPEPEVAVLGRVRWSPEIEVTTFMRWLDTGIQFDFANIKGTDAGWGRFSGANVSVKRSFAARVGPFDQEHFPYGYEDTDWAYRASLLGMRLLYAPRALVDHYRPMSVEMWQRRARRIAEAERRFVALHPELRPWFHTSFASAAAQPAPRGRGVRLARYVPRRLPLLGPRVWAAADLTFRQALAPHFLEAWEKADGQSDAPGPDLSEFEYSPSKSGGPK